jgi:cyanophycinase-like exopeptidase
VTLFGLLGSGEFLPWAGPVDTRLAESSPHRDGRVLIVPTASAPEGDAVFERWAAMGTEHYRSLGLAPEVVPIKVREDAARPEAVAKVRGASLVFFSGGNPAHLCRCLRGTPFWSAVVDALAAGCALAGSSAGISFLGAMTLDSAIAAAGGPAAKMWVEGMGYFHRAVFGPHWDALEIWRPGAQAMMLAAVPDGCAFLGVDEDAAVVGDGLHWEVQGRGRATVHPHGEAGFVVEAGERFELALAEVATRGDSPAGATREARGR